MSSCSVILSLSRLDLSIYHQEKFVDWKNWSDRCHSSIFVINEIFLRNSIESDQGVNIYSDASHREKKEKRITLETSLSILRFSFTKDRVLKKVNTSHEASQSSDDYLLLKEAFPVTEKKTKLSSFIYLECFSLGLAISLPLRSFGIGRFKAFWFVIK